MNQTQSWYVANGPGGQGHVVSETDGRNVAITYDEKDAPLVAAAPELLKALEIISLRCDEWGYHSLGEIADAAIAKARGE